jgi:hypothetical protein
LLLLTGASIAQQQLLTVSCKLAPAQQPNHSSPAAAAAAAAAAEQDGAVAPASASDGNAPADSSSLRGVWQQLQQQLDLQALLQAFAAAANGSSSQTELLAQLDAVAEPWLQQQLRGLLNGTVACSISTVAGATGTQVESGGSSWPLIAPAATGIQAAAANADAAPGTGLLICRMMPAADGQPCPLPLLVKIQP